MSRKKNKTSKSQNFYLMVLDSIKENGKIPKLPLSKQALNWYVSRLKKEGLIRRIGYGVWEATEPPKQVKETLGGYSTPLPPQDSVFEPKSDSARLHNLVFRIDVGKLVDWGVLFDNRNINYQLLSNGVYRVLFNGFKVWFVRDRVIVYVKPKVDFLAFRVDEALRLGLEWFYGFVRDLEGFIGFCLSQVDGLVWSVKRKHISLIKNALAMGYGSRGERLRVSDGGGVWLVTDRSKGVDELEFVRSGTNTGESVVVQRFFNDLKANPLVLSDITNALALFLKSQALSVATTNRILEVLRRMGGDL